jgi:hypothetical protein
MAALNLDSSSTSSGSGITSAGAGREIGISDSFILALKFGDSGSGAACVLKNQITARLTRNRAEPIIIVGIRTSRLVFKNGQTNIKMLLIKLKKYPKLQMSNHTSQAMNNGDRKAVVEVLRASGAVNDVVFGVESLLTGNVGNVMPAQRWQ